MMMMMMLMFFPNRARLQPTLPPLSRGQRLAVLKAATRQCCHHVRWVPLSPGTQAVTIHGALHLHMGHCAHAPCATKHLRNAGHV